MIRPGESSSVSTAPRHRLRQPSGQPGKPSSLKAACTRSQRGIRRRASATRCQFPKDAILPATRRPYSTTPSPVCAPGTPTSRSTPRSLRAIRRRSSSTTRPRPLGRRGSDRWRTRKTDRRPVVDQAVLRLGDIKSTSRAHQGTQGRRTRPRHHRRPRSRGRAHCQSIASRARVIRRQSGGRRETCGFSVLTVRSRTAFSRALRGQGAQRPRRGLGCERGRR